MASNFAGRRGRPGAVKSNRLRYPMNPIVPTTPRDSTGQSPSSFCCDRLSAALRMETALPAGSHGIWLRLKRPDGVDSVGINWCPWCGADVRHYPKSVAETVFQMLSRRLENQRSWLVGFNTCLDGIPEINLIPGSGLKSARTPDQIRRIVQTLVAHCSTSWEMSWKGGPKRVTPPGANSAADPPISGTEGSGAMEARRV